MVLPNIPGASTPGHSSERLILHRWTVDVMSYRASENSLETPESCTKYPEFSWDGILGRKGPVVSEVTGVL